MRPLPYTHTGAGVVFYAVLVTFFLLEMGIRVRSQLNRSGSSADRRSIVAVWACVAGGLVAAFLAAASARGAALGSARWTLFGVGIALMVAGIVIRQWSAALLGRFFTTDVRVHADQVVVDTGPYRWVRHPSYTGLLLTLLGIGLALGNWAALVILIVVPAIGLVVRIKVEERALVQGLGEPYRRFAATRARLVPGVW